MTLTSQQRFVRLFNGQPVDRAPFLDIMNFWPSSLARWKTEGLAQDATGETVRDIVGFDGRRGYMLPVKRFTAALRQGGCKHVLVDSDGDQRPLAPLWIEGGVNILFPWETQFGLDITAVRRRHPKLGIMGGINKFALAHGREAIDRELDKVPFMLEQGRYLPGLDHGVPTDVSWDDYRYFYDRLRALIWKYPPSPEQE